MHKKNFESLNFRILLRRSYLSAILPGDLNRHKNKINDDIKLSRRLSGIFLKNNTGMSY
jgi:hypothetical protein